jgi:hypothetical protein
MARIRPIRSVLATIALGGLLGFLVPSFAGGLQAPQVVAEGTGETPAARQFIVALLTNDQDALRRVSVQASDALEAARLGVADASVTSLTLIGRTDIGGAHYHAYVAEFTTSEGEKILRGFRVATVGGYAILVDPPEALDS